MSSISLQIKIFMVTIKTTYMKIWFVLLSCFFLVCVKACEEGYTNNNGFCEINKCNREHECPSHFTRSVCNNNICGCKPTFIWNSTLTSKEEKNTCECPAGTQLVWTNEYPHPRCITKGSCYDRFQCTQQGLNYNYPRISCSKNLIQGDNEKEIVGKCICNYGYIDVNYSCVCISPKKESYSTTLGGTFCLDKDECMSDDNCFGGNNHCQMSGIVGKCV